MSLFHSLRRTLAVRRGVSPRHLAFVLSLSFSLWTIYGFLAESGTEPPEEVFFWPPETPQVWADRAAQVKSAFLHAYHGYERHAFPHDELGPKSNSTIDNFNGWGVTAVDSLDTMLLMGLDAEYKRAIPMITAANFSLPSNTHVPFFETVIRYLGGLLSAYALSGDRILLDKADELATKLSPAFHTPSGFPNFAVDTFNKRPKPQSNPGVLAEVASFQLEYAYLGKLTGKKAHIDHVTTVTNKFYNADLNLSGGMYPTGWGLHEGKPSDLRLSVGAAADSAHEYTLKQFLLTTRSDRANLEMYLRFTTHVINNLLYVTPYRELLYVTDSTTRNHKTATSHNFEHLSCFFPGLLALGSHLLPLDDLETIGINMTQLGSDLPLEQRQGYDALTGFDLKDLHLWAAEGIAQTCYLSYADQPTGLGPEVLSMRVAKSQGIKWMDAMQKWKKNGRVGSPPGVSDKHPWVPDPNAKTAREKQRDAVLRDYYIRNTGYYLRPEAVESFYILWRATGDIKWRHRGWSVFQAIERAAKTPSGYASVDRVQTAFPTQLDTMPSYFLAETLKYLYLLFLEDDVLPLEKWVFNTEAHPLPVFAWTESDKEIYNIV